MSIIIKNYTFSSGATILASEHNSNFNTIYADYNGNITNSNISATAAIANSKLNLTSITQNVAISGNLTLTGSANDFSGATISDLGTVTTADINGGTIDGVQVDGATATGMLFVNNASDQLAQLGSQGTSGQILTSAGTGANPTWSTLTQNNSASTNVFCWAGVGNDVTGTALNTTSASYVNVLRFRYKKVSNSDTITCHARMWSSSAGSTEEAFVKILINTTLTEELKTTTSTTPTWITGGTTIDVSSLSDGTTYDGLIQIKSEDGIATAYCSAITLIGS